MSLTFILNTLIAGLTIGSLYALIALGYTLVYGIIELINFAHGDVFMVGAFLSWLALNALFGQQLNANGGAGVLSGGTLIVSLLIAFAVAMVSCAILGVLIERLAYRPLRRAPRLAPLVTAIGVSFILETGMQLWQGADSKNYPSLFDQVTYTVGNVSISNIQLIVIGSSLALMVALLLLVQRTRIGRAMRAAAQDPEAATMMGVDINRIIMVTFLIGSALAGAAGVVWGISQNSIDYHMGFIAGLKAFTAAVLGGIGNIRGAMLGGLLIGVVEQFVETSGTGAGLPWSETVVFLILVLVLVVRPTGLLGTQVAEKA
jgi:branched-chain amino acid transport system permease protein